MKASEKHLKKQLRQIIEQYPNSLRAEVAREALDCGYEIEIFFSNLLSQGCESGMIASLIYYEDTRKFFDRYYEEIEEIRVELEAELGSSFRLKGDLKNWYAWMAFEEIARIIADEFNLL